MFNECLLVKVHANALCQMTGQQVSKFIPIAQPEVTLIGQRRNKKNY